MEAVDVVSQMEAEEAAEEAKEVMTTASGSSNPASGSSNPAMSDIRPLMGRLLNEDEVGLLKLCFGTVKPG